MTISWLWSSLILRSDQGLHASFDGDDKPQRGGVSMESGLASFDGDDNPVGMKAPERRGYIRDCMLPLMVMISPREEGLAWNLVLLLLMVMIIQ